MKVEPSRVVIASLLLATSARAQTAHVRDVTPDMGIVFQGFFSEGFALLGHRGVFASSANAGFRHSQNGGERAQLDLGVSEQQRFSCGLL